MTVSVRDKPANPLRRARATHWPLAPLGGGNLYGTNSASCLQFLFAQWNPLLVPKFLLPESRTLKASRLYLYQDGPMRHAHLLLLHLSWAFSPLLLHQAS